MIVAARKTTGSANKILMLDNKLLSRSYRISLLKKINQTQLPIKSYNNLAKGWLGSGKLLKKLSLINQMLKVKWLLIKSRMRLKDEIYMKLMSKLMTRSPSL
jgi:hypothetical protein